MSSVVPFRGINLYIEELAAYAEQEHSGTLMIMVAEDAKAIPVWVCGIQVESAVLRAGHGETLNAAVLDLYRSLRSNGG